MTPEIFKITKVIHRRINSIIQPVFFNDFSAIEILKNCKKLIPTKINPIGNRMNTMNAAPYPPPYS